MGTDYRLMYDRNFLGHLELPEGADLVLTIARVSGGELTGSGGRKNKKPVIHFMEDAKPFALNKTNGKAVAKLYGNMVEEWAGKRIALYRSMTRDPSGTEEEVPCVRVRPKAPEGPAKPLKVAGGSDLL